MTHPQPSPRLRRPPVDAPDVATYVLPERTPAIGDTVIYRGAGGANIQSPHAARVITTAAELDEGAVMRLPELLLDEGNVHLWVDTLSGGHAALNVSRGDGPNQWNYPASNLPPA